MGSHFENLLRTGSMEHDQGGEGYVRRELVELNIHAYYQFMFNMYFSQTPQLNRGNNSAHQLPGIVSYFHTQIFYIVTYMYTVYQSLFKLY
jgi:hypothetical protein